ncbi:UDP-2,3-diacylglucosamine hydrolase [Desulfuromusa kysingii]|uniref:UDP-2,3-diacylglucosamine hydrolase n=1 Tax=Desulfuromusa kysingii TaxID=37625 RepID=A0A1H3YSG8_9BACT|nr:UDP-2,3-diacylglucosamine diphosphatase [Desulfuromusa kysingii]SEA14357.1 UDP-2,3-diacylglucosamine hydrolase [Desulfuromusa kysingii]
MKAIFLSDAHLRHPQDNNYLRLLDFLDQQKDLDALFLLGDIFEFWLGYKHLAFTVYIPLLEKLRQLSTAGTQLYFVEGNHDFNLGPYFTDTLNCTVIPDQQKISWDGKNILISHGDLVKADRNYQRLRSFWRSWPIKVLAKIIHPDMVWSFALWLSNKSSKNNPDRSHYDPSDYLIPFAETSHSDIVVCGHFHYPLDKQHQGVRIIALGDWITQFSYAEMQDGEISLKQYVK